MHMCLLNLEHSMLSQQEQIMIFLGILTLFHCFEMSSDSSTFTFIALNLKHEGCVSFFGVSNDRNAI